MSNEWKDFTHGPAPSGWQLFLAAGGRVVFICFTALAVLAVLIARDTRVQTVLESRGQDVVASVVVKQKINADETIKGSEDRHRVWLRFELPGQGVQVQPKEVGGRLYDALEIGEQRDIRVLPDTPDIIELTPGEFLDDGMDLTGIAVVVAAGMFVAIWVFGRQAVSALKARRGGITARGKVTAHKGEPVRLYWKDERGLKGRSLKSAPDRYMPYVEGSEITLFLAPDGRAWWIGDTGPRQ